MHKAVLEDGFGHHRGSLRHRQHRHKLRLHVRGKAGIRLGHHVHAVQTVQPLHHHAAVALRHLDPSLPHHADRGAQMLQPRMPQKHGPAGDRRGARVASSLDTIRDNRMFGPVQRRHAFDRQSIATDARDLRAHSDQALRKIADLRLPRGIGQHGAPLGQGRRHQQVLGGADRHKREHNLRPPQPPIDPPVDVAALQVEPGAHLLQSLDMQVHRPSPDLATAGQGHARLPDTRHQGTQHQERRPHLAHNVVRRLGIGDGPTERQHAPLIVLLVHRDAVLRQQLAHRLDVRQPRHIRQHQPLFGQQPRGH